MKEFTFYQDEKITIWQRHNFTIKADNEEQAKEIMKQNINSIIEDTSSIAFIDSDLLLNTVQNMTVEKNDGKATVILFDWDNNLIGTNAD